MEDVLEPKWKDRIDCVGADIELNGSRDVDGAHENKEKEKCVRTGYNMQKTRWPKINRHGGL